jgi:LuxR family maltose regulon positive regulatory protein
MLRVPDAIAGPIVGATVSQVVSRPRLFARLGEAPRVMVVSAPPGSGKTVLVRSWIDDGGRLGRAAWVAAGREARDPQRFWLSVVAALRRTAPGSALVRALTAAPDLDGWAVVECLLTDLAPLRDRLWLVIDDVHELSPEVLRQLEIMVMRAPPDLRFVLATRHDIRLGLHRLRLAGELTEIRETDLRFTQQESRELFTAAGLQLPPAALVMLHERTEGWAAGLRLAALSLPGHPDPERFAAEFSGSERTVAEYLVAEVLDRQSEQVRRLLLRTSILERVNGELAELLTGDDGGERILQDLEQANAFVTSLDPDRTWFRYHQLFADLLRLELRRTAPGEVAGLQRAASAWFAAHGYPVEAVRHAQAANDFDHAARLIADHWPSLYLDGQAEVIHELLAGFPAGSAVNAELAAVTAADELAHGTLDGADWYLGLAERALVALPDARRGQAQLLCGIARLLLARQLGNLPAMTERARQLQSLAATADPPPGHLGEDLRALALISLGVADLWAARFAEAQRYLEQGIALARQTGRPYLEFTGLAHLALSSIYGSLTQAARLSRQAIGLAERHGWAGEPAAGIACVTIGVGLAWQGRLDEAEPWIQRAEGTIRAETEPASVLGIRYVRGLLDLARGRHAEALAVLRAAEPLGGILAAPPYLVAPTRALLVLALVRAGETGDSRRALAELSDQDRDRGELRVATAAVRLAEDDPAAALAALAPIVDGAAPFIGMFQSSWRAQAFVLAAIALDRLGSQADADTALERALDLAEPRALLTPFLLHPAPDLLQRHAGHRTTHAALIGDIHSLLAGNTPAPPSAGPSALRERLSNGELRVLRYLPTNLTAPEIARELSLSHNTVKTHLRNLYTKLGAHRRSEAVTRARDLGLLAPITRRHTASRSCGQGAARSPRQVRG